MTNVKIHTYRSIEHNASKKINAYLKANAKKTILFLLSGGSSFALLPLLNTRLFGGNITIGVLDERFDQREDINNFLQLKNTDFFVQVHKRNCHFIDTSIKLKDKLMQKAKELEDIIKNWKVKNPDGVIVITQGIGNDGHTAGIFPFDEKNTKKMSMLISRKQWIIGYNVSNRSKYPLRITPTFYFLENIVDKSFMYVVGEEKKKILQAAIKNKENLEQMPAKIIHSMKDVEIFTNIYL